MFYQKVALVRLFFLSFLLLLFTSFSVLAQDVEGTDSGLNCDPGAAPATGLYCDNYQTTCTVCNTCGDIYVGGAEECDDNDDNGPLKKCTVECKKTFCGDELIQPINGYDIAEQCDLGAGNSNTGICSDDCQITKCGDGFTQAPNGEGETEECDAGADNNNHGECNLACEITTCGDGLLQQPNGEGTVEQCDGSEFAGGMAIDSHICKPDCTAEVRKADFLLEAFYYIHDGFPEGEQDLIPVTAKPGPEVPLGKFITFVYKLSNPGNVKLKDIVLTDNSGKTIELLSNGDGDAYLSPDEEWTYIIKDFKAGDPGIFEINADAEATDADLNTKVILDHKDSGYYCDDKEGEKYFCTVCTNCGNDHVDIFYHVQPKAAYEIRIFVKDENGNLLSTETAPGAELQSFTNVSLVYKVVNTGNLDLDASAITITDDTGKTITLIDDGNGDDTLDVGEEWIYETSVFEVIAPENYSVNVTVGGLDIAQHTFDLTDLNAANLTDPVTTTGYYFIAPNPAIKITTYVKKGNGDWVLTENAGSLELTEGQQISLRYDVENVGNLPLTNIVVTDSEYGVLGDDLLVDKGNNDNTLDLKELWTYVRGPITVPDGDLKITITVTGETPDGTTITEEKEITLTVILCKQEVAVPRCYKPVCAKRGPCGNCIKYQCTQCPNVAVGSQEGLSQLMRSKGKSQQQINQYWQSKARIDACVQKYQNQYKNNKYVGFRGRGANVNNIQYLRQACARETGASRGGRGGFYFQYASVGTLCGPYGYRCVGKNSCGGCAAWACKPRNDGCFPYDAEIELADGSIKLAGKVVVGDNLINPLTGQPAKVIATQEGPEKLPYVELFYNGRSSKLTSKHIVLTTNGLKRAIDLDFGDVVFDEDHNLHPITALRQVEVSDSERVVNFVLSNEDASDVSKHFILSDGIITGDLLLQQKLDF